MCSANTYRIHSDGCLPRFVNNIEQYPQIGVDRTRIMLYYSGASFESVKHFYFADEDAGVVQW